VPVLRPDDQHPVGDLSPGCPHPAFGRGVRPRTPRRNLHHLDPRARKHRVERLGELPSPIANQEPEPASTPGQIHEQVPRLLPRPRAARVRGHAPGRHGPGPRLDHEEYGHPAQGDRTFLEPHRRRPAGVLPGAGRCTVGGPAAGASAAACPASPAGLSATAWGAAGPEQPVPPGRPSPASAWGAAAAAPRPPGAARATRRPSTPTTVPAAPSTRSGGPTSDTASVGPQARDPASDVTFTAGKRAAQPPTTRFETPQGRRLPAACMRCQA
jgi:hypothetical protein